MKLKNKPQKIKDFWKKKSYWERKILFLVIFLITFIFYPYPYCLKVTGIGTDIYCFQGISILQGVIKGATYSSLGFFLFSIEGIFSLIKILFLTILTLWFYNKLFIQLSKKLTFIKNKKLLTVFILFIIWGLLMTILFSINILTTHTPIIKFID